MDVRPLIMPGTFSSTNARGRKTSTIRMRALTESFARGSPLPRRPFWVHCAAIENGWHGGPAAIRSSSPRAIPSVEGSSTLAASSTVRQSDRVQLGRFRSNVARTTGSRSTQCTVWKPACSRPRSSPPIPVKRDRTRGPPALLPVRRPSLPRKAAARVGSFWATTRFSSARRSDWQVRRHPTGRRKSWLASSRGAFGNRGPTELGPAFPGRTVFSTRWAWRGRPGNPSYRAKASPREHSGDTYYAEGEASGSQQGQSWAGPMVGTGSSGSRRPRGLPRFWFPVPSLRLASAGVAAPPPTRASTSPAPPTRRHLQVRWLRRDPAPARQPPSRRALRGPGVLGQGSPLHRYERTARVGCRLRGRDRDHRAVGPRCQGQEPVPLVLEARHGPLHQRAVDRDVGHRVEPPERLMSSFAAA